MLPQKMMDQGWAYLQCTIKQFEYYKHLGESTICQMDDQNLNWLYHEDANSIGIVVNHLWGNMMSRWTDFLTTDGEKDWRDRDREFEQSDLTKEELLHRWSQGWECLLGTLNALKGGDLERIVYIRNQGHTVLEAIQRQLAHYAYHIGQIVFIGKMLKGEEWQSLSIPKGASSAYNQKKFSQPQEIKHFTDEFLNGSSER